ncbi:MAG: lipid A biosynthesis acyltransferase [Bacteroidetes bacterium]|nr:MAG: lipid A biosynthesis acyltransferase [Bacteroidota bacterium]
MQAIGFYFALPFIYFISILPFPVLYLLSDFVFVLIYYVIGYRRSVVTENMHNSFPEKSKEEIAVLRKKFYRYLTDLILETFKTLTISKTSMLKHCRMNEGSIQLMNKFYHEKKSCILVLGHLGNWEWGGNTFSATCKHPLYVIYHPLENQYFNRLVVGMRTRFGTKLIEMKNTFRDMISTANEVNATAFIADQTPPPESAYWTKFLNQETPVFQGTEKIARKLNYPVVNITVKRVHRGYYDLCAEVLCEGPASTSEGEISELHTRKLEEQIRLQPETWLWSHRRWKHKRPG